MKTKRDVSYIKVWVDAHGPIPKDEDGRSYEIHHIDGNPTNNILSNLACLPISHHYEVHLNRGDHLAARAIAMRMGVGPEIARSLLSEAQRKRIEAGTHNWLTENGGSERSSKRQLERVKSGTHHFVTKKFEENRLVLYKQSVEVRKKGGSYHMLTDNPNNKRVEEGTHNFIGSHQNMKMLAEGKHPSQIKKECLYCSKVIDSANYSRYHGDKCKMKESNEQLG